MKSFEEKLEKINDKIANSKSIIVRKENEIMKSRILNKLISIYNYKGVFLRNFQKEKQSKNMNQILLKRKLEKANEYNIKSKLIKYNSKVLKNKILTENKIKIKVQNLQNEIGKMNVQNYYKSKKAHVEYLNEKDIKILEKENLKMLNEIYYIKKLNNNRSDNIFSISRSNSQIIKSHNSLSKQFL